MAYYYYLNSLAITDEVDVKASFPLSRFAGDGSRVHIDFALGDADSQQQVL